jgi:hypothetical protein
MSPAKRCFFSSGDSMMTWADMPVFSSTCSCTVWPSFTLSLAP